ncbi:DUF6783 domain-containing protein [Enterocloster sp. OA13]|uniref:DUF6783 domain-containing protein n=1 Tax=Enterocloster sp. OA13 TaxID=2914161 RepID=UPI00336BF10D
MVPLYSFFSIPVNQRIFFQAPGARLIIAFRRLCVPLCGRFGPDDGGVAGYAD